ncbi:hypothetical protein VSS37_03890 [Candidatus Thiothrix sp. Deng01]|uniref:Uncharacterized protein n=1 Tax=Candidatus Thiothrix phosphatis TaxID=3112415 RepID=A0ABU6CTI1_9GAMM|nr:hypothetical protein [Candidatus Thiothrix sp. Deng01]MEB4590113.1 hypothetical protein [Candidatus Thiothrix sp. Deng01]
MDIYKVRQANAQHVIDKRFDGVKAHFANEIKTSTVVVNRWFAAGEEQRRNIGSNAARKIEQALGLPYGWLDQEHESLNDLEADAKKRTALRIASGETYPIPLRQTVLIDQRLRLTLIDQLQGNLMLLSTDKDAYALQLHGHNPTIWLHHRWLIVIEPNTPIAPDECLLLTLKNGELLLRLLVHDSPTQMAVRNPVSGEQEILLHDQIEKSEYAYIGIPPSKVTLPTGEANS